MRIDLITDVHFTKYSYIHIPGYILIKNNHLDNTTYSDIAIELKLNNTTLIIPSIYSSSKHNMTNIQFIEYFSHNTILRTTLW